MCMLAQAIFLTARFFFSIFECGFNSKDWWTWVMVDEGVGKGHFRDDPLHSSLFPWHPQWTLFVACRIAGNEAQDLKSASLH